MRGDSDLAGFVDLQHQVIENQGRFEGIRGHGREPAIPERLVVLRQIAKATVASETVVHAHALAHEAVAVALADDGTSVAEPRTSGLFEQPRAICVGQRRNRDGVLAIQPFQHLVDIGGGFDEADRAPITVRFTGSESFGCHG